MPELFLPMTKIALFCREHGIRSLSLFGSVLHGNAHRGSDIDLLVEYDPNRQVGLFAVAEMEGELSALLERPVDLRTLQDLSLYFRDSVLAEARVLYEA
jgi:predicted nucleotidyltransferase